MMKKNLKMILKNKMLKNGMWLYILQLFNTAIPLLTLPYITRVLGPSEYGIFSSALNLVGYFQVIVEYGFNLSGARKVAIAKDKKEISSILSRITVSKLLLCMVTFVLMVFISMFLNLTRVHISCMIILYSMVIGTAIQQTWLFHGLQVMKYITIVSVIARTTSVLLIFLFIKNTNQVLLYCSLYALTYLLMGIISSILVRFKLNIHMNRVTINDVFLEIKDGWYLFTTSAMTKIFSGIGITLLTFTTTSKDVGIYSAIQKIPYLLTMLYAPIGQIIYPYISQQYTISFKTGVSKIKKILGIVMPIILFTCGIIIICSRLIVDVLYGPEYSAYSNLVIPLIISLLLSILNNLLGIQVLVASGHLKEYSIAFRIGVIAILIFNIIGSIRGMYGVAIATMLAEFILTITIIYYIKKVKNTTINNCL
jgi:PST family polysaccharide transporter